MAFVDGSHAPEFWMSRIARRIGDLKIAQMWRELTRPVTFFDLCLPRSFLGSKIGEFFKDAVFGSVFPRIAGCRFALPPRL
jgi:hypothetical protein